MKPEATKLAPMPRVMFLAASLGAPTEEKSSSNHANMMEPAMPPIKVSS